MSKKCGHASIESNCGWCKAQWYQHEKEDVRQALIKMRDVIAELYAIRGEDADVSKACNKALEIAHGFT